MSQNKIQLFACPHPFKTQRIERKIAQGSNLLQILEESGIGLSATRSLTTYVYVDDLLIPREQWSAFIPEGGNVVTVRVAPGGGGGGGGKDPMRVILTLSVIALSLAVPHLGVFGAQGALAGWGGVAGFGVAIGGMLAVNALVPPQTSKVNNYDTNQIYSITGARNQADPWGPCLKIFGKRRVFPRLAAMPYTELVGSDQYLRCLFDVGYAPLELSDHKIGETALDEFDEVQYEAYQNDDYLGDGPDDDYYSIYPDNVHEDQLSIELTQAAGWQLRTTQANTDELGFDITFPGGLWFYSDANNKRQTTNVQFECQYAVKDSENWINFIDNTFQTLTFSGYPTTTIAVGDSVTQASTGASGTITYAGQASHKTWNTYYDGDGRLRYETERYTAVINVSVSTGVFSVGSITVVGKATPTVNRATTPTLNVTGKYDNLHRLGYSIKVPNGQYDIRWRRLTADHSSSSYSDSSYITALRSLSYANPVNLAGRCLVALRIKASDQLSGAIDQYNCVAEALLPAHDGSDWHVVKTRSPAWAYADVLRGAGNHRALSDSKIDIAALRAWDLRCETAGRKFDAVVDSQFTVFELLTNIAATGRATPGIKDNLFTVVEDIAQTVPIQHFTPRNSWGFVGSKLFPDQPHALKCRFENEDEDYQPDELVVCDDGYYNIIPSGTTYWQASTAYATNDYCIATPDDGYYYRATTAGTTGGTQPTWPAEAGELEMDGSVLWICEDQATRFETMDFWGYVDSDHVWKDARYLIACARLRPEVFTFNTDVEHIVCTRGDLIRLSHDVLSIGYGAARITEITTTGGGDVSAASIDNTFTMAGGTSYGVRIRKSNGVSITASVVNVPGDNTRIEFNPDISAATAPAVGDLMQFGVLSLESIECIVTRIEPGPDLTAKITCVHAASAVHSADQGLIPQFVTNITKPPIINRVPPTPVIVDYRYDAHWVSRRDDDSYQVIMTVTFTLPTLTAPTGFGLIGRILRSMSDAVIQGYQAQYRESGGAWISLPVMDDHTFRFNFEVANGSTYDFRVRSFASRSSFSPWDTESDITISLATLAPPAVSSLQVKGGGSTFSQGDCEIEWTGPALGGTAGSRLKHYKVQVCKTDDTQLRIDYVTDAKYNYTLSMNRQDNSGTPIPSIKFNVYTVNLWDQPSTVVSLTATNAVPTNPQNLTYETKIGGVVFNWDQDTALDFSHFLYRFKIETGSWSSWYRTSGTRVERNLTDTEKGTYGGTATIYIEVKTVDIFARESSASSTNADAENFAIGETDIDDFAITASKFNTKIPVVQGLTLTNDSPTAGNVAWSACTVYYNGTAYSISSGNTTGGNRYIYWKDLGASFASSATHPGSISGWAPGEDFIIAVNDSGIGQLAWNAIANQMIGSAWILDACIGNAKISDLDAGKINAGYLDANRIQTGSLTVSAMSSNVTDRIFTNSTRDFADIGGTTKPANNATVGADWDTNLSNIPSFGDLAYEDLVETAKLGTTVISGGYLVTSLIQANSIVVGKLASDATNRMFASSTRDFADVGGNTKPSDNAGRNDSNLIADPRFMNSSYWTTSSGAAIADSYGEGTEKVLRLPANFGNYPGGYPARGSNFPLKSGETYYVEARVWSSLSGGYLYAQFNTKDKDGTPIGYPGTGQLTTGDSTWKTVTTTITITGGNNVVQGSFGIYVQSSATSGEAYVSYIYISKVENAATVGANWSTNLTSRPTELTDGRVSTALDATGYLKTKVIPASVAAPSGAGLYLGSDYSGYYNGSAWRTYMSNAGTLYAGDGSNEYFSYTVANGVAISTAKANAITIKSGGDIIIESGGDLTMQQGTAGNPSILHLRDGTIPSEIRFEKNDDPTNVYFKFSKKSISGGIHSLRLGPNSSSWLSSINIGYNDISETAYYADYVQVIASTNLTLSMWTGSAEYTVLFADTGGITMLRMKEDAYIGLGSSSARFVFDGSGGYIRLYNAILQLQAMDGTNEGGEMRFAGAGSYETWTFDCYQRGLRMFLSSNSTGTVTINNIGSGTANLWVKGDVSGESITDRCKVYIGESALNELSKIAIKPGTELSNWAELDHDSMPEGTVTEYGRDLGATVSLLMAAVLELNERIK